MTQIDTHNQTGTNVAIVSQRGDGWGCLLARINPMSGVTVDQTATFSVDEESSMADWIAEAGAQLVRVLIPGSSIVCRTCSLPEAEPEQLEEALQLQTETKLLGTAPMHRTAAAMLPAPAHATTRTGLILAWPDASTFTGPDLEPAPLFIPDIAALASLVGGLHPKEPAVWIDREDGTVSLVMAQQERVHVRTTKEHLPDVATTRAKLQHLLLETAINSGSTVESSRRLAEDTISSITVETPPRMLHLPESVVASMAERVQGCSLDPEWINEWGLSVGAALAMSDELVPLTMFQDRLPEETPTIGEFTSQRLSSLDVAASLVLLAVVVLAIGPLVFHGSRVALLSVMHPGLDEQVRLFEENRDQQVMYGALMSESWPMSKLLADIASNTPEGIEIDSIRLGHGEPIRIQGMAMPSSGEASAALATRMKAMLEDSGVFTDVTLRWEDSETFGNRSFDISASVKRPQYRPAYDLEQDFGTWTLSERKSGQDADGNWADGTEAVASTSSPSSPPPATVPAPRPVETTDAGTPRPSGGSSATASRPGSSGSGRTPRPTSSGSGLASRGDADDRAGDLSSVPTGTVPEPLTTEQIQAMSLEEARIKLQEIAEARKRTRDPEAKTRMKDEFQALLKHMRELQKDGGS
ncbi:MAG TPA: hypothetical protein DEO57_05660 [Phycisphaerales bacterium]|nr:hypothetical protein [Phycisphaerales bacterium]